MTQAPTPARTPEQRATLLLASVATLLALATFITPLVTQGRTAATLAAGPLAQPWLLSGMSLGLAAALLPTGALADDLGRRRTFVLGLVVLALGALTCALAPNVLVFIGGRVVQGLGGAAVIACALGLLGHAFPPGPLRAHATGTWGAAVGGGIAAGGLLAVAVDHGRSWRGSYAVTAALALVLAVVAARSLVESRAAHPRRPDLLGAVLLGVGIAALCAALVEGRQGWTDALVLVLAVAALALLAGFVAWELQVPAPMLDLALFRRPQFVAATVAALANGAGAITLASLLPTVVQQGLGASLLVATLLNCVFALISVATALNVRRLPARVAPRAMLVVGLLGIAVAQLLQTGLQPSSSPVRLLPAMVVLGVFFGLVNAALGREAVASVPPGRTGMGSGANNTARYVGSAIGVSVAVLIATRGVATGGAAALVDGWNTAALVTAGTSVVGALVVAACRPLHRSRRGAVAG